MHSGNCSRKSTNKCLIVFKVVAKKIFGISCKVFKGNPELKTTAIKNINSDNDINTNTIIFIVNTILLFTISKTIKKKV